MLQSFDSKPQQVFAGPMSESVPSSVTGFAHRRSRADSTASFTYLQESDETPEYPSNEAIVDESDAESEECVRPVNELASSSPLPSDRNSSSFSNVSADDPLLYRHNSTRTDVSYFGCSSRKTQKIYVTAEDLTIVVAGFSTRPWGLAAYIVLCTVSLGLVYLLLRWLPRWRVGLVGFSTSLRDCTWVVVEVRCYATCITSQAATKAVSESMGSVLRSKHCKIVVRTQSLHGFWNIRKAAVS